MIFCSKHFCLLSLILCKKFYLFYLQAKLKEDQEKEARLKSEESS